MTSRSSSSIKRTLYIRNATVIPVSGHVIDKGTIIVRDGKITSVKKSTSRLKIPSNAEVIDADGLVAAPGFVDAHSHIGLLPKRETADQYDGNELSGPLTPEIDVSYGIWPQDPAFEDARKAGVTTMMIVPGSGNLIGGMGCIVKSCLATSVSEMELKDKAALKMALGSNPKITYGQEKSQSPVTRMAAAQMIRRAFRDAQEYSEEKHYDSKDKDKSKKTRSKAKKTVAPEKNENPRYDYGNENLLLALERTISCHIHCSRADDIYTALRISREFNLKPVLVHAADALLMEKEIQKSDAGLILGPLMLFNPEMPETENGTFEAAAECIKRGIKVSIMSDHPIVPVEYFGVQGALLCRHGVSADEAMKALTLNPAELLGCGDRVGVIEKGHDADIVLYSGHPLAFDSHTVMTVINGEIVYKK